MNITAAMNLDNNTILTYNIVAPIKAGWTKGRDYVVEEVRFPNDRTVHKVVYDDAGRPHTVFSLDDMDVLRYMFPANNV